MFGVPAQPGLHSSRKEGAVGAVLPGDSLSAESSQLEPTVGLWLRYQTRWLCVFCAGTWLSLVIKMPLFFLSEQQSSLSGPLYLLNLPGPFIC